MINLRISNYQGQYTHLNGDKVQRVSPFDLARAIVTIGKKSWSDTFNQGIFRIGELICKAFAFSKMENGNLVLNERFYSLNQSEKGTVSYYFGQGLTKLFAEEFFNIKWLFHFDDYEDIITVFKRGTVNPKIRIGKSIKPAARPDLIGFQQIDRSFIFEAKGHSWGYKKDIMQHAIDQVSQVKTYNGIIPEARTACYFDLSKKPIKGTIIDPDDNDIGIDIELKENIAIERYYSFFVENQKYFSDYYNYRGYEFLTTPVGAPNIFFGFDKRILQLSSKDLLTKGLYDNTSDFSETYKRNNRNISIGLDGIILLDNNYHS